MSVAPAQVQPLVPRGEDDRACIAFLETLAAHGTVLCAKAFRVELGATGLPVIPCLDHEAELSGRPAPHASAYFADAAGELHEVSFTPSLRRVAVDAASTLFTTAEPARTRFVAALRAAFPDAVVAVEPASVLKGEHRVAEIVHAHVSLREVLVGADTPALRRRLEQLRAISDLMEKESRVSSWGIRTVTPMVLGSAGFVLYALLDAFRPELGDAAHEGARIAMFTVLGGAFLYVGLQAVRLTAMGTRVWKRATEYRLILEARARGGG